VLVPEDETYEAVERARDLFRRSSRERAQFEVLALIAKELAEIRKILAATVVRDP
jgi:hypothetical protein